MKLDIPSIPDNISSHSRESGSTGRGKLESGKRSKSFTPKDPEWEQFKKQINTDRQGSQDSNAMLISTQTPLETNKKKSKSLLKASSLVFNLKKTSSEIQVIEEKSEKSNSTSSGMINLLMTGQEEDHKNEEKLEENTN